MILNYEWGRPLQLRDGAKENLIYTTTLNKLPAQSGIYIFGAGTAVASRRSTSDKRRTYVAG